MTLTPSACHARATPTPSVARATRAARRTSNIRPTRAPPPERRGELGIRPRPDPPPARRAGNRRCLPTFSPFVPRVRIAGGSGTGLPPRDLELGRMPPVHDVVPRSGHGNPSNEGVAPETRDTFEVPRSRRWRSFQGRDGRRRAKAEGRPQPPLCLTSAPSPLARDRREEHSDDADPARSAGVLRLGSRDRDETSPGRVDRDHDLALRVRPAAAVHAGAHAPRPSRRGRAPCRG